MEKRNRAVFRAHTLLLSACLVERKNRALFLVGIWPVAIFPSGNRKPAAFFSGKRNRAVFRIVENRHRAVIRLVGKRNRAVLPG